MRRIDLAKDSPSLGDLLALADKGNVVLRTVDGRHFVLAEIDDFDDELERVRDNKALMQLLDERSKEPRKYTLKQIREELESRKKARKRH